MVKLSGISSSAMSTAILRASLHLYSHGIIQKKEYGKRFPRTMTEMTHAFIYLSFTLSYDMCQCSSEHCVKAESGVHLLVTRCRTHCHTRYPLIPASGFGSLAQKASNAHLPEAGLYVEILEYTGI